MRFKFCAGLAITLLVLVNPGTALAENIPSTDLAWPVAAHLDNSYTGFSTVDSMQDGKTSVSQLLVFNGKEITCTSFTDSYCLSHIGSYGWSAIDVLPPCTQAAETADCIEKLSITSGGVTKPSTLIRTLPYSTYPADPARGLAAGGAPTLWSNPFSNAVGTGFYLAVSGYAKPSATDITGNGPWNLTNFTASLTPYTTKTGSYKAITYENYLDSTSHTLMTVADGCIWKDNGTCGQRAIFGSIERIELQLRLNNKLTGWLAGRLKNPNVSISKANDQQNYLTISAEPTQVAFVSTQIPVSSASPEVKKFISQNIGYEYSSFGIDQITQLFNLYKDSLRNTNTAIIPSWSFTNGYGQPTNPCLQSTSNFTGLVTTNAATFQFEPPIFDGTTLNYKVASLHLQPNGQPFEGTYDLLLDSKAARCLYGFSSAPISATISIVDENGVQSVSTSVLTEKDGWLHLGSYGFHFSNPTLKVKITQSGPKAGGSSGDSGSSAGTAQQIPNQISIPHSGIVSLNYLGTPFPDLKISEMKIRQNAKSYLFSLTTISSSPYNLALFPAESQVPTPRQAIGQVRKGKTTFSLTVLKSNLPSENLPLVIHTWSKENISGVDKLLSLASLTSVPYSK